MNTKLLQVENMDKKHLLKLSREAAKIWEDSTDFVFKNMSLLLTALCDELEKEDRMSCCSDCDKWLCDRCSGSSDFVDGNKKSETEIQKISEKNDY